jgi:hypothetical protein
MTASATIIGHNPGLQDLAATLVGYGPWLQRLWQFCAVPSRAGANWAPETPSSSISWCPDSSDQLDLHGRQQGRPYQLSGGGAFRSHLAAHRKARERHNGTTPFKS